MQKKIEISGARARLDVLKQSLAEYERKFNEIPNKALVLTRLQREMQNSVQLATNLFEKLQEAKIAEESELGYVEVIDSAVLPEKPVSPRVPLNLLFGALLGLVVGVGVAFLTATITARASSRCSIRYRRPRKGIGGCGRISSSASPTPWCRPS